MNRIVECFLTFVLIVILTLPALGEKSALMRTEVKLNDGRSFYLVSDPVKDMAMLIDPDNVVDDSACKNSFGIWLLCIDGEYGYLLPSGEWLVYPRYEYAEDFQENGIATVKDNGKYGLIRTDGEYLAEPRFESDISQQFWSISEYSIVFSCKVALVYEDGLYGFLREDGTFLFEPQFEDAHSFSEMQVAMVKKDGLWGYVTLGGEYLFEPQFDTAWYFSNNVTTVFKDGKYGLITLDGGYLVEPQFDHVFAFVNGYAIVQKGKYPNAKRGFVGLDGQIIEPCFDNVSDFHDGYACVMKNNLYGYIDTTGEYVIQPRFVKAQDITAGLAAVSEDGEKWGVVDLTGNYVLLPEYENVKIYDCGFIRAKEKNGYTLFSLDGKQLLQGDYESLYLYEDGAVCIEENGQSIYYTDYDNEMFEINTVDTNIWVWEYSPNEGNKVACMDEEILIEWDPNAPFPRINGEEQYLPMYAAFVQATYPTTTHLESLARNKAPLVTWSGIEWIYYKLLSGETDVVFCDAPDEWISFMIDAMEGELEFTPVGHDALMFTTNSENPLESITLNELKAVYTGQIKEWKELGVEGIGNIVAYQRFPYEDSQLAFEELIGVKAFTDAPMICVDEWCDEWEAAPYRSLPNSIGYAFGFFLKNTDMEHIKFLSVEGISPTSENIKSGAYPSTKTIYAVTHKNETNPNVQVFLDWITGPQGQKLVEKCGYVGMAD